MAILRQGGSWALRLAAIMTVAGTAQISNALPADAATEAVGAPVAAQFEVQSPAQKALPSQVKRSPYRSMKTTDKAKMKYFSEWGVENLRVSSTNSGNLIRFTYRVDEPLLAQALLDHNVTPYMYSPKAHAVLQVPVMDKIGPLRQSMSPKAGQEYWVVFSNKGSLVKPGDRVNVMIGNFRADGLMVE